MPKPSARSVFAGRLRSTRTARGLSQMRLGVLVGLSEDVASTRINRYEQGVHTPDLETAARMAEQLGVPLPYLFAKDERMARAILEFARLPMEQQDAALSHITGLQK
ncbi:MAG: helix-turn-helix transcriptional regulator [Pseudoxanthomonas sp.]